MSTPKKTNLRAKRAHMATLIKDRPELEAKLGQLARATIMSNALTAELNAEIEAIKARFAPKLEAHKEAISECATAIESYVVSHRAEIFAKDSKTATVAGHELSLRDNGGSVETLKGITQATVLDRLLNHEDEATADLFIRYKSSLDKEAIKAKWPDHVEFLSALGLKIEHAENFAIKLHLEEGASSNIKAA